MHRIDVQKPVWVYPYTPRGLHKVLEVLHRVLEVQHRVLEVLHRVLGVLHKVLEVLHRVLGYRVLGVLHRVLGLWFVRPIRIQSPSVAPEPVMERIVAVATGYRLQSTANILSRS